MAGTRELAQTPRGGTRGRSWLAAVLPRDLGEVLLALFLLTLPLTDVLAPSPWLPIPLTLAILLGLLSLRCPATFRFSPHDRALALVVCAGVIPYLWSLDFVGPKTLSHLGALIAVILFYFIGVRGWMHRTASRAGGLEWIYTLISISLGLLSAYVLFEFLGKNVLGRPSWELLPHVTRPEYEASVLQRAGLGVQRARGTASESGTMALFFELAGFLSLPALLRAPHWARIAYYGLVVAAYTVLFSVGGLCSVFVAVLIYLGYSGARAFLRVSAVLVALASVLLALFPAQAELFYRQTLLAKLPVLDRSAAVGSWFDRFGVYERIARVFFHYPLGIGIGITPELASAHMSYRGLSVDAGQVSLYGTLLVSGGIVALLAFLWFYLVTLRKAVSCGPYRGALLLAGISLAVHHVLVAEFWLPNLWVYFAVVFVTHRHVTSSPARLALGR